MVNESFVFALIVGSALGCLVGIVAEIIEFIDKRRKRRRYKKVIQEYADWIRAERPKNGS